MKSINEFATEYAQDKYLPVQTSQAVKAGANYVLNEIEEIINHPLRFVNVDKTVEESMIKEISKLVEQLKK